MPSVLGNTPLGTSIALESDLQQTVVPVTEGVPFDAEVEYVTIPANGGNEFPWISTTNSLQDYELEVYFPGNSVVDNELVFGPWNGSSSSSFRFSVYQSKASFTTGASSPTNINIDSLFGAWGKISCIGNTVTAGTATGTTSRSIKVVAPKAIDIHSAPEASGTVRVRAIRLFVNGVAIFDAIPVRVGTVGRFFDKVSKRLSVDNETYTEALVPGPDVSTPTFTPKTEIDLLAPLASPAFTGTPTAPTASSGTNSTQVATTAFVQSAVGGLDLSIVSGKLCVSFEE